MVSGPYTDIFVLFFPVFANQGVVEVSTPLSSPQQLPAAS